MLEFGVGKSSQQFQPYSRMQSSLVFVLFCLFIEQPLPIWTIQEILTIGDTRIEVKVNRKRPAF